MLLSSTFGRSSGTGERFGLAAHTGRIIPASTIRVQCLQPQPQPFTRVHRMQSIVPVSDTMQLS